jgi:type II restriction enzyme
VQVTLPRKGLENYKSLSQRAGIASEAWALRSLYCPSCDSPSLNPTPKNTPAIDFSCQSCNSLFQLKAQGRRFSRRIQDAAYSAMVQAIRENRTPNLYALHYDPSSWCVEDLTLIPNFAFPLSAIEKRNPLSPTARRAGWVGCNILLDAIPLDARISVIVDGIALPQKQVRQQYARIRPLEKLKSEQRGWTLDVLNAVRSLGKSEFDLAEVYKSDSKLAKLHPANRHVRDKIRQQLQVLRDLRILEFLGGGEYRLR